MKGKMYILMAIVMVSLCVAGCGKNNEKQESYGKNNEKQKSSSESKKKKVKSVKVSVEDIKAMYKGWTIEEQENGIEFNTFDNDERNYFRVFYFLEGDQCRKGLLFFRAAEHLHDTTKMILLPTSFFTGPTMKHRSSKIGRASCRERV